MCMKFSQIQNYRWTAGSRMSYYVGMKNDTTHLNPELEVGSRVRIMGRDIIGTVSAIRDDAAALGSKMVTIVPDDGSKPWVRAIGYGLELI